MRIFTLSLLALALAGALVGQDTGIAWYGTWKDGLDVAKKSGRPIFLVSAAPHCRNISGIW